jgi:hypothetical protein
MDALTVVLTGAGIVEKAWAPVLRALQAVKPEVKTPDAANTFLAARVHLRRFWQQRLTDKAKPSTQAPSRDRVQAELFADVTRRIAAELESADASAELQLRPSFYDTWITHVAPSSSIKLITTNWDFTLEAAAGAGRINVKADDINHLHGDRRNADRLYLPTEVVAEPYRTWDQRDYLGRRQLQTIEHLRYAQRLVITGLALSALDTELNYTLAVGLDEGCIQEVIVADPDHRNIVGRLRALAMHPRRTRVCDPTQSQVLTDA